jgi:hypothetical protein
MTTPLSKVDQGFSPELEKTEFTFLTFGMTLLSRGNQLV